MFKKLLIALFLFLVVTSPVLGVYKPVPEKGSASLKIDNFFGFPVQLTISFWNVGLPGGDDYGKGTLTVKCLIKVIGNTPCNDTSGELTFTGGPNGTFQGGGQSYTLVNGQYFDWEVKSVAGSAKYKITVENPEIFSKYDWSEYASVKSAPVTYDEKSTFANSWDETFPPNTYFDENEAVITKIYGDVEVADRAYQKNFIQQGVSALQVFLNDALFGREKKYYHWDGRGAQGGNVEISDVDLSSKWFDPFKGMPISDGNKIKTGDGRAVLEFKDGTKFILRENSQITFSKDGIYLNNGKYLFHFNKLGHKIYLLSKHAKFSITGTELGITVNPDETRLQVYEGSVLLGSITSKKIIAVNANEEVNITDTGLGEKKTLLQEQNVDINAVVNEVINNDFDKAKKLGMYIFGGLILIVIIVLVLLVKFIFGRKRTNN